MGDRLMKTVYNFKRTEKKYLITKKQYDSFHKLSGNHIKEDENSDAIVNNIYFDNDDNFLIRQSISKPLYKEKIRLRGYNNLDQMYLEIKKKYNKVVYKRRVPITFEEIDHSFHLNQTNNQIEREINYLMEKYKPKPKYYISYIRLAYKAIDNSNLRITFDKDVLFRLYDLDLRYGRYGESLLDEGVYIMEIKSKEAMPLWLVNIMNYLEIYPTTYSKVGNIYKREQIKRKGEQLWT